MTGPGNPYCSSPAGLTGEYLAAGGCIGDRPGTGGGGPVALGVVGAVRVAVREDWGFCLEENRRAEMDAPAAAEVTAIIARVVFDMASDRVQGLKGNQEVWKRMRWCQAS